MFAELRARAWQIACGVLLILAIVACLSGFLDRMRLADCQKAAAKAVIAAQEESNKRAAKLQRKIDALPKAEGKIADVVRENPSACERPAVVSDSLRAATREANAARKVSTDP